MEHAERLSIGSISNSDESTYQSANYAQQKQKPKRRIQINDLVEVYFYTKNAASAVDTMNTIEGIPVAMPQPGEDQGGETSGEEDYDYVEFD